MISSLREINGGFAMEFAILPLEKIETSSGNAGSTLKKRA